MSEEYRPNRMTLPTSGVHVFPFMSSPTILAKKAEARFLVVELTPVEQGRETEARCQIPMTKETALRLVLLIGDLALQEQWEMPEGMIQTNRVQ